MEELEKVPKVFHLGLSSGESYAQGAEKTRSGKIENGLFRGASARRRRRGKLRRKTRARQQFFRAPRRRFYNRRRGDKRRRREKIRKSGFAALTGAYAAFYVFLTRCGGLTQKHAPNAL